VVFTFRGKSQNFTTDRRQLIAAVESFVPKGTAAPGKWSASSTPLGPQASAGPPLGCQIPGFPNCLIVRTPKYGREPAITPRAGKHDRGPARDCQFALPLARLAEGEYLLTVEASAAKTSARREVRFRVEASER
jgi:hypothetical protein